MFSDDPECAGLSSAISQKVRKVLIVAYHFPPQSGSSGFLRSLNFCRYLPECGWLPVVLTVNTRAYDRLDHTLIDQIPPEVSVVRAFALDAQKHLSIRGRYSRWLALPDRWVSWCLGGIPAGLLAVFRKRIDVILTTFPIPTANLIGLVLHRITGKPWVVDLRDSMTEDDYPREVLTRRVYRWIEKQTIKYGSRFIFTAASTQRMYLKRYPGLGPEKTLVIPNGYEEEDFRGLIFPESGKNLDERPIRLLHGGVIYPQDRDPRPFFRALARLKREGRVTAAHLRVDLRASGSDSYYSRIVQELGIADLVHLLPPLPYRQALQDAADADALLLLQGVSCNHQIPAKAYEYLRLRKPILALTHEAGDTAALLREVGGATIVDLADEEALYLALPLFLRSIQNCKHPLPDSQKILRYARKNQAHELARYLSQLASAIPSASKR